MLEKLDRLVSEKDTGSNKGRKGNMGEMLVTSNHAQLQEAQTEGALITQEEELERSPRVTKDEEGEEIVELGRFSEDSALDTSEMPDTISLPPEVAEESALFTSEEAEQLREAEGDDRYTSEELEAMDRVEEALDDPDYPNNRRELWLELAREEGKFGLAEDDYDTTEEAVRSELSSRSWVEDSKSELREKSISDLSGGEFAELVAEATSEGSESEELAETEEEETEVASLSVPSVDSEVAKEAAKAWSERGDYWEEMSEDLSSSANIPNTFVQSSPGQKKTITTGYADLKVELEQLEEADILERSGDVIVAEVPEGVDP